MFHLYKNVFVMPENVNGYAIDKNVLNEYYTIGDNLLEIIDKLFLIGDGMIVTGSEKDYAEIFASFIRSRTTLTSDLAYELYKISLDSFKRRVSFEDSVYGVVIPYVKEDPKILSKEAFFEIYTTIPDSIINGIKKYNDSISFELLYGDILFSLTEKFKNSSLEYLDNIITLVKTKLLRILDDYLYEFSIANDKILFKKELNNEDLPIMPKSDDYKEWYDYYSETGVINKFTESSGVEGGYGILYNKVINYISELDKIATYTRDRAKLLAAFFDKIIENGFIDTMLVENTMVQKMNPYIMIYLTNLYKNNPTVLKYFKL